MKTMKKYILCLVVLMIAATTNVMAQSSGAYIHLGNSFSNTGYYPNRNTKVQIHLKVNTNVNSAKTPTWIYGCYDNSHYFDLRTAPYSNVVHWVVNEYDTGWSVENGKHYMITISNGTVDFQRSDDGEHWNYFFSSSIPNYNFTGHQEICIGADNYYGKYIESVGDDDYDIYEIKIWENNQMKRHYLPGEYWSENQRTLYDLCNGKYLSSYFTTQTDADNCSHKYANVVSCQIRCPLCGYYETNAKDWISKHKNTFDITAIDPFLNINDDGLTSDGDINQILILSGPNKMGPVAIFDASGEPVTYSDGSYAISRQISIPNTQSKRDLWVTANTRIAETTTVGEDDVTDSVYCCSAFNISQIPFYQPYDFKVQNTNIGSDGILMPKNDISWYIKGTDSDILSDDYFIVNRAYKNDYSDMEEIDATSSLTSFTKEASTGHGLYTISDQSAKGQYNAYGTVDKSTVPSEVTTIINNNTQLTALEKMEIKEFYSISTPVYYYLYRAVPYSIFGDEASKFVAKATLSLHNILPPVSAIGVEKTDNWSNNKQVMIHVKLNNPYVWEFNDQMNATNVKDAFKDYPQLKYRRYNWDGKTKIKVTRSCPSNEYDTTQSPAVDAAAETLIIEPDDVTWNEAGYWEATIEDVQALPYTHYYYTAELETSESLYPTSGVVIPVSTTENEANECYSETVASVGNFTGTRGTANGAVYLNWKLGISSSKAGGSSLKLIRKDYLGLNEETGKLDYGETVEKTIDNTSTSYTDSNAKSGHVYEYTLVSTFTYRGAEYTTEAKTLGWVSYVGHIEGKVLMPNGTAIAGATVKISRTEPIDIPTIKDEFGNIILEGVHEGLTTEVRRYTEGNPGDDEPVVKYDTIYAKTIISDSLGRYSDDVYFTSESSSYTVAVAYGTCTFNWTENNEPTAQVTLSDKKWEYKNVNLVANEWYKYSGTVLYENSTMPVRNAHFELVHYDKETGKEKSHETIVDQNGEPIQTNQRGEFSISLIPISAAVRVVKDGHTMKDKWIRNAAGDSLYTPTKDQAGLTIWDQTKVTMVGRVVGGVKQGGLPLGQSLSKNNLGDNLTVVLQLEGDNTSQIVYLKDDPDNTTINKTYEHPYYYNGQILNGYKKSGHQTEVSYQRKRIVITPDKETGEFWLELPPSKYKVTQLSADGYATLYQDGEAFDVLDYTDLKDTVTYNRVYHKPATVTCSQYTQGKQTTYIGEPTITTTDLLTNKDKTITVASEVNDNGSTTAQYAFGYPVFQSKTTYELQATIHEDYYYNNDPQSGKVDIVYLDGGKLHVRNGLSDDNTDKTYTLDKNGQVNFFVPANSVDVTNTGTNALHTISMEVEYNDYYYDATPISGFILGEKRNGTDAVPIADQLNLMDIIRDPYGATSYAWREKGTTYHWAFDKTAGYTTYCNITGDVGLGNDWYLGVGCAFKTSFAVTAGFNLNISNIQSSNTRTMQKYEMTTTERIQTSDNPLDVGAMADVYIGTVNEIAIGSTSCMAVVDKNRYDAIKDYVTLVQKGVIPVTDEGQVTGDSCFIVIGDNYQTEVNVGTSDFAYSQKYILGTLIPDLEKKRDALVLDVTRDEAQTIANNLHTQQYYKSIYGSVIPVPPNTESAAGKIFANEYERYQNAISNWKELIRRNEKAKVEAMQSSSNLLNIYSVADASVDYSREASGYNQSFTWSSPCIVSGGISVGAGKKGESGRTTSTDEAGKTKASGSSVFAMLILDISVSGGRTNSASASREYYKVTSAGFGYHLDTNKNGYMSVGVYKDPSSTTVVNNNTIDGVTKSDGQDVTYSYDSADLDGTKDETKICNYIFRYEGGASRQPWYPADVTQVYQAGTSLGVTPLKIDNPKIYIDSPVVSNQPEDEAATFQIRMTNATEIAKDSRYLVPSIFMLYQDESTNPNGLQLLIDGAPIGDGREFEIAPGQTILKTMKVEKGVGFNFDDVKLCLRDQSYTLGDTTAFSVNYLPMATNISITSPTNKWVMNTLSASDDDGYYIPVNLGSFNVNSEGFHHIELQYKKQTEGDGQWVNLCSFYNNDSIYNLATGEKHMINNGKIQNVKFHGEQDPVEMKYDLRAVAFRQLGTGFTTRASEVMSGTKDTHCPEVFGVPSPASGILTYEDVIQMNFTEPIAYNYLDKVADFQVQGYTNNTNIALSSSLYFPGENSQKAETSLTRNLNQRPFTIDMMAKVATDESGKGVSGTMALFSHGDDKMNMVFGVTSEGLTNDYRLFARVAGVTFKSKPLSTWSIDLTSALTHIGMTFDSETGKAQFFAGGSFIDLENINVLANSGYSGAGIISLGKDIATNQGVKPFNGNMRELRLWSKVLDADMVARYNGKRLTGYEKKLIGHWPMTETDGTLVADGVHGANIRISGGIDWSNIEGYSLVADKTAVNLDASVMSVSADADNTLGFWFKTDSISDADEHVSLFTAGSTNLNPVGQRRLFVGFEKDDMVLISNGNTYTLGTRKALADAEWHYFAYTVNRDQDKFAAFIDGKLVSEDVASNIDGIASDIITLGDNKMKAHFDRVTQWKQSLPHYMLQHRYNTCFSGKEMGLNVYLPFTVYTETDQGVMKADTCTYNCTYSQDEDGVWHRSTKKIVLDEVQLDRKDHAPLRQTASLENLDFSWTSTGTSLQINLNTADKVINKQNVYVTVRGIEDDYGNVMKSPKMLTYFVNKNVLKWDKQTLELETNEGTAATGKITWKNSSGKQIDYVVDGMASWMSVSDAEGTADPQMENTITITTDENLSPGKYTSIIYLTDANDLSDALTVNLTVKPSDCGWKVDKTLYDRTMNLRGFVQTKDCNGSYILNSNPQDKVGAFIDNECVGVANITADENDAYVFMTIYGDEHIEKEGSNKNLTFMLWDSKTGNITQLGYMKQGGDGSLVNANIAFKTNSVVGLPGDKIYNESAVLLRSTDLKEQTLSLNEGWNWISFYLAPQAMNGINTIFINQSSLFSQDDIIKHVDFDVYNEEQRDWMGTLDKLDYKNVFQIYVHNAGTYKLFGKELSDAERGLAIKGGENGTAVWNDLPYLLSSASTIDNALADFQIGDKAQRGDIVKGFNGFAVADINGENKGWVGNLTYMKPGHGYYIYHHGHGSVTVDSLYYKQDDVLNNEGGSGARMKVNTIASATPIQANDNVVRNYETSMPVIAQFADGVDVQTGDKLVAYVNGMKVGEADAVVHNGKTLLFLLVNGEDGQQIVFAQERDGNVVATTTKTIGMETTGVVGTLENPYQVSFDASVDGEGRVYDLSGRRLPETFKPHRGSVYITKGKTFIED